MQIKIGNKVSSPVIKNQFEIITEHYSGDADAYHTNTCFQPVGQEAAILEAYAFQESIYDLGLIHDATNTWPAEARKHYEQEVIPWPSDVYSDGDYAAQLDGITIFFYDAEGTKYECSIED